MWSYFSLSIHLETPFIFQKSLIKFYFTSHWSELGQISISLSLDQLGTIMEMDALSDSCMRTLKPNASTTYYNAKNWKRCMFWATTIIINYNSDGEFSSSGKLLAYIRYFVSTNFVILSFILLSCDISWYPTAFSTWINQDLVNT